MKLALIGEMVLIALRAIWNNKLRSLLTILGNIVAVASIVTLVSLIQGITEEVTDVILSEVGADSFMVDRRGITNSEKLFREARTSMVSLRSSSGSPPTTPKSADYSRRRKSV